MRIFINLSVINQKSSRRQKQTYPSQGYLPKVCAKDLDDQKCGLMGSQEKCGGEPQGPLSCIQCSFFLTFQKSSPSSLLPGPLFCPLEGSEEDTLTGLTNTFLCITPPKGICIPMRKSKRIHLARSLSTSLTFCLNFTWLARESVF